MTILIIISCLLIISIIYFIYKPLYSSTFKLKGNQEINADKLMIVAHPDDEFIFGGSELLKEKGWKVVCLTGGSPKSTFQYDFSNPNIGKIRIQEFINMMNTMKAKYEMWDYEDYYFNSNWDKNELISNLKKIINEKNYKKIVTHNPDGEYGHIQHKKVSKLVTEITPLNKLYYFSTNYNHENKFAKKLLNLTNIYDSQKDVIRQLYVPYIKYQSVTKAIVT